MKYKINLILLILIKFFNISIQSGKVEILSSDSKYLNNEYISLFQIPTSIMTLYSNGGERSNHELTKAFDNNWDTQWFSEGQQGNSYTNPITNITYDSLVNNIIITFKKTVIFDKMVYKTDNCKGCEGIGYPLELKIYSKLKKNSNEIINPYNDSGFTLIDDIVSDSTQEIVLFTFNQTIKSDQVKIEWGNIKTYSKFEKFTTAKEIILLFPETEYFNETMLNIFSKEDYTQMTLIPEFNNVDIIEKIIEKNQDLINFNGEISNYLKRAKLAAAGSLKFDEKREFTTNQKAKRNIIRQRGNVASHARNTLKMAMAGTNRQSMGIYALAGEKITFYVTGEENDNLPYIRFTQYIGHYSNWLGSEISLKIGKQSYRCNNFNVTSYSIKAIAGGPIYLSNPYTSEQQSQNVKIYVEGGTIFPSFRLNESEDEYKLFLSEYVLIYKNHEDTYLDITELFGYRTMITVPATSAYQIYKDENKGPIKNLNSWDEYIKKLFIYDGIEYEDSQSNYDIKNTYVNLHIRYSQPFGAAYASAEHIGIFSDGWINTGIFTQAFGWGFAHEIGHTMDINERTVSENSNNMISKYDEAYLRRDGTRGEFSKTLNYLTLDDVDVYERGCTSDTCKGYFTNLQMNYLVWWYLESFNPGYWGKLDNMYRYEYSISEGMTRTERLIFFSNIIIGIDLGYYFYRWGFFLNNEGIFVPEDASTAYKTKMEEYINTGTIKNNIQYKFWYLDYKEYLYNIEQGEGCYKDKDKYDIQITKIFYINNSRTILLLPEINCKGHLGFEIYENNKLIGFTYETKFIDTNKYDINYIQKYKIIAIDRKLIASSESETKNRETDLKVCSFNSKIYNSIKEAVEYAESLDTNEELNIYLLKDTYESTITINKNINIYLNDDTNNIKIYRIDDGALFEIKETGSLLIEGKSDENKIILDGLSISHKGNLIYNYKGVFKGNFLTFQNNFNSDNNGGALWGISGTIELNNSLIYNNYATNGGGYLGQMNGGIRMIAIFNNVIFNNNTASFGAGIKNNGKVVINNCQIKNCHSNNNGGGVSNDGGGECIIQNTKIFKNIADNMGGGLYIDGATTLTLVEIIDNDAKIGGGITFAGANNARVLNVESGTIITNNNANLYGGGIFIQRGISNLNGGEIYDNKIKNLNGFNISNHSEILLIENGEININGCKFDGSIFKSSSSLIKLKSGLLKYKEDSRIYIDFVNNGYNKTLLTGNNYCITTEDLYNINLIDSNSGNFELSSLDQKGNSLLFIPKLLSISFNTQQSQKLLISLIEENEKDDIFYYGKEIILSEDLFPVKKNEYISRLYDQNGNEYTLGQKLKLIDNIQFLYDIGYKNIIILDYIDYKENKLLKPDEYINLPSYRSDYDTEKIILNWKDIDTNEIFKKYEKVEGDKNRTLLALYSEGEYFLIKIFLFDNNSTKLVKFDDDLIFPNFSIPSDNHFLGWKDELENKTYDNKTKFISVKKEYIFFPVIVSYIKYYINNDLMYTETYDVNETFTLLDKSKFSGAKITHWIDEKNNAEYYYDNEYILKGDIVLYAVLERNNILIIIIVSIAILFFLIAVFITFRYIKKKNINNKIEEVPANSPIAPKQSLQPINED